MVEINTTKFLMQFLVSQFFMDESKLLNAFSISDLISFLTIEKTPASVNFRFIKVKIPNLLGPRPVLRVARVFTYRQPYTNTIIALFFDCLIYLVKFHLKQNLKNH